MKEKLVELWALYKKYREVVNYLIFGVLTTLVSWISYSLCEKGLGMSLFWAGAASWVIAVAFAFVVNKLFVFESKSWKPSRLIKELATFWGGRVLTGVLEVYSVPLLVRWGFDATLFGVEGLPAKIVTSIIVMVLNYFISKFVSFRKEKEK